MNPACVDGPTGCGGPVQARPSLVATDLASTAARTRCDTHWEDHLALWADPALEPRR